MLLSVHKFGGTSVDEFRSVQDIVETEAHYGQPLVVVSAFSGHTNELLEIAEKIIENPRMSERELRMLFGNTVMQSLAKKIETGLGHEARDPQYRELLDNIVFQFIQLWVPELIEYISQEAATEQPEEHFRQKIVDHIVGLGEKISHEVLSRIFTLRSRKKSEAPYKYPHIQFEVDEPFLPSAEAAHIEKETVFSEIIMSMRKQLAEHVLWPGTIPVISGYIGNVPGGILHTIDRGYTDTTAALTAVALKDFGEGEHAVTYSIHKRVPGVLSADPRIVEPGFDTETHRVESDFRIARVRRRVSQRELAELSVLARMQAVNANVLRVLDGEPVSLFIRNTLDPKSPGTVITKEGDKEHRGIRFVAGRKNQTMLTVESAKMAHQHAVAGRIFSICGDLGVPVDAITTSATSVSFSVPGDHARKDELVRKLEESFEVQARDNMALICCVGNGMGKERGLLSYVSGALADAAINIEFDCGHPDANITFIVDDRDYEQAIQFLHRELIEKEGK